MALADYRLCDVCDGKVFYDANLSYNDDGSIGYLGDWCVICDDCAKTHECVIVKKDTALAAAPAAPIPSDDELPGMWSGADLIGGWADSGAPAAQVAEQIDAAGWVVTDGQDTRWRYWGESGPEWTAHRHKALRFARRCDAEAFARDDDDAWAIQLIGQSAAAPAVAVDEAMVERLVRTLWPNKIKPEGIDSGVLLRARIALTAALRQGEG